MNTKFAFTICLVAVLLKALFQGQPVGCLIPTAQANEFPKIIYTVDETDALTYAAKAELHIQQSGHALEDKFLAYHMIQILREHAAQGERFDLSELMKEANQFKEEVSKETRTASGELKVTDMKEAADHFYSIFQHLPLFGDYVSSLHAASDLMNDIYSNSITSDNQIVAQLKGAQRVESLNQIGNEVYSEIHALGRELPSFDIVVDGVFSHDFGDVSVHDTAKKMRDEDPALNSNIILRENLGADGRLNVDLQKVTQAFNELSQSLMTEFHELKGEVKDIKAQLDSKTSSEKELQALQTAAATKRAQESAQLDNMRMGLGLYCRLISKFDPENGRILTSSVQAGYDIAQSLSRYKESLVSLNRIRVGSDFASSSSTFKLTSDLVQVGLTLVNSLFSSGPSAEQIILEQLSTIKTMIKELAETLQDDFEQVDGKLNLVLGKLDEQMTKLTQLDFNLKTTSYEISEIQRVLLSQQAQLDVLGADILRTMERSFLKEMDRNNQKHCLESDAYTAASFMPYNDYRKCVDEFASYASRADQSSDSPSFFESDPIRKNIGFLSQVAAKRGNFSMLPPKSDSFVDPVAWSIGSEAYLKLLEARPEFARLTSTKALKEMLTSGNQLLQTLQGITVLSDGNGGYVNNAPFLLGLIDSYLANVSEVSKSIQKLESLYQADPTHGTHGFPLWPEKGTEVTLQFGKKIPRCGNNSSKQPLLAPTGLNELLPTEVKTLQQIAGKGLEVCYELRPIRTRLGNVGALTIADGTFLAQFARLSIDLIASYEGKRITIHHAETTELAGGSPDEPDNVLTDRLAAILNDSPDLMGMVAVDCHYGGLIEYAEVYSHQKQPSSDCLYGKYIQDPLIRLLGSSESESITTEEKATSMKYFQEKLDETLKRHRSQFRTVLIDKLKRADDLQQSLKALDESAHLAIAYIKMGLPKSLASNDMLHASVYGKSRLLSSLDVVQLIESDPTGEEAGSLINTLNARAVALRNQLAELLKNPTIEPQPLIEDTMRRLHAALDNQSRTLPQVSLDNAWNDLRSAVSSIR